MMNCPACKTVALQAATLSVGLPAHTCGTCGGSWLAADDYQEWSTNHPAMDSAVTASDPASSEDAAATGDSPQAKLCPACKHILTRYRVGHGVAFRLEHCGTCNGTWLDRGEWETLTRHGLDGALLRVFTEPWQRAVRQEEQRQTRERFYGERLGEADYAELRRIRTWLVGHSQKSILFAYLNADDPYRAE